MQLAQVPHNEKERIKALLEYNVLDTLPEKDYDNMTKLAAEICQTPISLISFIDPTRQWFKSHHGLDVNETPRELAFCSHAINKPKEILIVTDSREDDRFSKNPLVTGNPHVIFYAGVPLVNPDGFPLGTLCIIDHKPKELSSSQIESLKALARQVVNLLELRKTNAELEKTVHALERKNAEMEQFVYVATHDLKEPLNTIINFSRLLKDKKKETADGQEELFLKFINESGNRLNSRINQLLIYARIGKTQNYEQVSLNEVLQNVIQDLDNQIELKSADIKSDALPVIHGIKTDLHSLFQNLLSNALKYSRPGVTPSIEFSYEEIDGFYQFLVGDNGVGFDNKFNKKVFIIFQRLNNAEDIAGTGIGLAHCKKIVELHGGQIWVESEKGVGSRFYFTIPK